MTDYDDCLAAIGRAGSWRVILKLDYCTRTHGTSPCTATGTPYCYYTYPTCKDPDNYSKGTKSYAFSLASGPAVADSLPYLLDLKTVPTEIRPRDSLTRRARITLEFLDDAPLALANPDKTVSNAETAGSFFRNLMARNPNAAGREAEIYQGFDGLSANDYRLIFKGVIERIEWKEGRARVVIKDQLKLLDKKVPPKQSSHNVLTTIYNGGGSMVVTDGAEFEAPGTVKLGNEYVSFTGVSANNLTGCAAGAYGSMASSHAAGTVVRQALVFAEPDEGEGLPPDEIFLALLVTHGGIDPLAIATVDRGAELDGGVSDATTSIAVSATEPFPETGVVRIDDEFIRYRGVSGAALLAVERGAYNTSAAAHDDRAPVLLSRFTEELGRWWSGTRFRRFVEKSTPIKNLVNSLRAQCLVHVWQAEDATVAAKCLAPPFFEDAPKELDDETGFINDSTGFDPGAALRASRVTVHYGPTKPDPSNDPDDYTGLLILVDAEIESDDYFGEPANKEVWGAWIYREHEAILLASRRLIRYRSGAATFKFAVELKDDDLLVGDFVRINSRDVIEASGAADGRSLYEVLKKQRATDNRIEFTAMDTRLDRRYPMISPTTITVDYDSADDDDHDRYGWIGGADNKVGTDQDDGYYVY